MLSKGNNRGQVRMKDIARDLGVSVVTVSKVLRGNSDIGPTTRKRVLRRIKELNYQPNWIARSLVTNRTCIIGVVVPDLMHSFFAEIAKGVAAAIQPEGYHLLIANTEGIPQIERQEIETLLARRVDGLILAPCGGTQQIDVFERITASRVPFVLVERKIPDLGAHFVGGSRKLSGCLRRSTFSIAVAAG